MKPRSLTLRCAAFCAGALIGGLPGEATARQQQEPGGGPRAPDDGREPTGHPVVDGASPHGRGSDGAGSGLFQPPEDVTREDPSATPGSIVVDLRDADDRPVPREMVTLGMIVNSIAKGDSRKHLQQTTDDAGRVVFAGLETASNIAYRVSSAFQGGAFAAMPFQMGAGKPMHVVLHVYPVVRDIRQAFVVCEVVVASEVRDDRIQVEEALTFYNLGRNAWQPDNVRMDLPDGVTAFNAPMSMSGQGVDEDTVTRTAKLRGTFSPGQHSIQFRWQVPWSGQRNVDYVVGLPPHVAVARVVMPVMSNITLAAIGFPPADIRHDAQGQSFLVSEKRIRPDEGPLSSLRVGVHGLPTPGPGRLVATLLSALGVVVGIFLGTRPRDPARDRVERAGDAETGRNELLEELATLEGAYAAGKVGPRTYERARKEMIDELARSLAPKAQGRR